MLLEMRRASTVLLTFTPENEQEQLVLEQLDLIGEIPIYTTLRRLFENHQEFYNALGFDADPSYHGDDDEFRHSCAGFSNFMHETFGTTRWSLVDDEHLKRIGHIILNRLAILANQSSVIHVSIPPPSVTTREVELTQPEILLNEAVLYVGNKAFKLKLLETEAETPQELAEQLAQQIRHSYEMQVRTIRSAMQTQINTLRRRLEEERAQSFITGLRLSARLTQDGWKVKDDELVYKHPIHVKYIKRDNRIVRIPENEQELQKLKVIKLTVPINPTIIDVYASPRSVHPNVRSDDGYVCLGDLAGKPLTYQNLQMLIKTLETANLDSRFDNKGAEIAFELWHKYHSYENEEARVWIA